MTSPCATSPYTLDDLYKILSLGDGLKGWYLFISCLDLIWSLNTFHYSENVGKPYSGCTSLISQHKFVTSYAHLIYYSYSGRLMFAFSTVTFHSIRPIYLSFFSFCPKKLTRNFFTFTDNRKHVWIVINQSMASVRTNERGSSRPFRFSFSQRQMFIWRHYSRCGLTVSCTRLFGKHP